MAKWLRDFPVSEPFFELKLNYWVGRVTPARLLVDRDLITAVTLGIVEILIRSPVKIELIVIHILELRDPGGDADGDILAVMPKMAVTDSISDLGDVGLGRCRGVVLENNRELLATRSEKVEVGVDGFKPLRDEFGNVGEDVIPR